MALPRRPDTHFGRHPESVSVSERDALKVQFENFAGDYAGSGDSDSDPCRRGVSGPAQLEHPPKCDASLSASSFAFYCGISQEQYLGP